MKSKKSMRLMLFILFLTSCLANPPQATVTPIPLPTATATAAPTPTLNPQFVALQESVAATGVRFTLMSDGSLTDAQNEGIAVAGLNGKDGKWTLQLADGTIVALDNTAVHLDDTNGYSVYGYTYDASGWMEVEAVKEYPPTSPEEFKKNVIPVEELFDGTYFHWLEEQAKTISCGPNMRTDIPLVNLGGWIIPDHRTAPNFNQGGEFFVRDAPVFGYTQFTLPDGQVVDYAVMPVFFCKIDAATGEEIVYPVITVYSSYNPNENRTQNKDNQLYMAGGIPRWRNDMNITAIVAGDALTGSTTTGVKDPLVARTFTENTDMEERFERFVAGDYSALSEEGIVLLNSIATISGHWFE